MKSTLGPLHRQLDPDIYWSSEAAISSDLGVFRNGGIAISPGQEDCNAMIDSLRLEHFRGFERLVLPRLSRFTILGGGNNIGKSSVLEAIAFHHQRANPAIFLGLQAFRGLTQLPLDPGTVWGPFFCKYDLKTPITISLVFGGRSETLTMSFGGTYVPKINPMPGNVGVPSVRTDQSPSIVYGLASQLEIAGGPQIQRSQYVLSSTGLGLEIEFVAVPRKMSFLASQFGTNTAEDANRYAQLDIVKSTNPVIKFLKIIEPRLEALSTQPVGNSSLIHGDIGIGRKIPLYQMGDGIVRGLSMILSIVSTRGGTVLIDEFGSGIHHSVLSRIIEAVAAAAKEFDVQIVATTHSHECLRKAHEGVAGKHENDLTYIRLDRTSEGIEPKTYDYETLGAALENGWEIR